MAAVSMPADLAHAGVQQVQLSNGLSVSLYDPAYLASRLGSFAGGPAIELEDGRYIPVITDIDDPSILNKGDGEFHPFAVDEVLDILQSVTGPGGALPVRVYVLPYPRRGILVSSTSGFEVFLSPHVLDPDPMTVAYIVCHELGHVFHNRFMPEDGRAWTHYRQLRGIEDETRFSDTAIHAYRPREILAEDFRVLFGVAAARLDGRVENPELVSPESVPGLRAFFETTARGAVASRPTVVASSYPNPFNPSTEIRVAVPAELVQSASPVSVRVYSVTGALVSDLYSGRATGDFVVRWDGTDRAGIPVASSTYYAAVQVGDERETVKLVLLK